MEFQNDIMFQSFDVNLIYYKERRMVNNEEKVIATDGKLPKGKVKFIHNFFKVE